MPLIEYKSVNFRKPTLEVIDTANVIISEYQDEGYNLTLRQLYYQFVSKNLIPNKECEYKKLGTIISDARLAGMIDWNAITDRTRTTRSNTHWDSTSDIMTAAAESFRFDTRANQDYHVEVWIEKDALIGVIESACCELDVPYLSCRGYVSQSAMWESAQRLINAECNGKQTIILHLGDHDPSGIDMTRDIQDRIALFGAETEVKRIALNMNQVQKYHPPPNPAKVADKRYDSYVERYGADSWELDALNPKVIVQLIQDNINQYTDHSKRQGKLEAQDSEKDKLQYIADHWQEVIK